MKEFESKHPFCDGRFHSLLEDSGVVGGESGWSPFYIEENKTVLPSYIKGHSYGEFIFDWAWAEFYQRMGRAYYPKMVHALPFTPINAPKILGKDLEAVFAKAKEFYEENQQLSSHHFLFTNQEENELLGSEGYLLKETLQYHFKNRFDSFDDFLDSLKTRKRKNIKKERAAVEKSGLKISWKSGEEIDDLLMDQIFNYYLTTIGKKHSYAYLNRKFFLGLPKFLGENLKIAMAHKDENLVAMSLFVAGSDCLYGRYWGIDPYYEKEYPFLHFELCYYQGMEYCFKNKIPLFEAGAQGEHKLLRGFEPVIITSYHHLREPGFHQAIKEHLVEHNNHNAEVVAQLKEHLPYKSSL